MQHLSTINYMELGATKISTRILFQIFFLRAQIGLQLETLLAEEGRGWHMRTWSIQERVSS